MGSIKATLWNLDAFAEGRYGLDPESFAVKAGDDSELVEVNAELDSAVWASDWNLPRGGK